MTKKSNKKFWILFKFLIFFLVVSGNQFFEWNSGVFLDEILDVHPPISETALCHFNSAFKIPKTMGTHLVQAIFQRGRL